MGRAVPGFFLSVRASTSFPGDFASATTTLFPFKEAAPSLVSLSKLLFNAAYLFVSFKGITGLPLNPSFSLAIFINRVKSSSSSMRALWFYGSSIWNRARGFSDLIG
jgi:hypothetical protein